MGYTDNFASTIGVAVDSLTAAELAKIENMITQKVFAKSDLTTINTVITGIRNGSVLPILDNVPQPDSFPFVDASTCDTTDCDVTNTFSEHTWELGLIECRLGICMKSFDEDFLVFFNTYKATQAGGADVDMNSLMLKFITDKFVDNMELASWRASYFGDKALAPNPFFDKIDGIFVQLEAGAGGKVDITQNAGATYAAQAITGEEVYDYLQAMYSQATMTEWFDPAQMEFRVTRSMAAALVNFMNTANIQKLNCVCIDPVTAGASPVFMLEGLRLNGIPIMTITEWDDIINYSSTLNGGGGNNARVSPHRAILSIKENILVGTTTQDSLNSFDMWYSKDDKKVYIEGSSYLGGGVPTDRYILAI
ncbi:hypothetical protein OAB94_01665 [Flavobacteriaceae bacterium]|nr:hypothetical protein [Flavobacteriaceae bacterium]MDB9980503.1 hypothetical protein [bacterium]